MGITADNYGGFVKLTNNSGEPIEIEAGTKKTVMHKTQVLWLIFLILV